MALAGLVRRPTEDIDVVGTWQGGSAGRWVATRDGRPDAFELDVLPVLNQLGFQREGHHGG